MNYSIRLIESRGDDVEVLGVPRIKPAEDGIRDMIRDLNQPRGTRVDKHRRVSKIPDDTPLSANPTEVPTQAL